MRWSAKGVWSRGSFLRALALAPVAALIAACTDDGGEATPAAQSSNPVNSQATATTSGPRATAASTNAPATSAAGETGGATATAAPVLQATPACGDDDDEPTPAQTEGPYFTPNSPERTSLLEYGISGRKLTVTGYVLGTDCRPIAGALVDFWQADDRGEYDNVGYKLRGHQFTDTQGRYTLETIVPGLYTGRTRHLHVKVQAPGKSVLTTQQYWPNEPANARDGIYRRELEMAVSTNGDGSQVATFNFVLNV